MNTPQASIHRKGLYLSPPPPPHPRLDSDEVRDAVTFNDDVLGARVGRSTPLLRLPSLTDDEDGGCRSSNLLCRQDNECDLRQCCGSRCDGSSSPNLQPRTRLVPYSILKKRSTPTSQIHIAEKSRMNSKFKPIVFENEMDK